MCMQAVRLCWLGVKDGFTWKVHRPTLNELATVKALSKAAETDDSHDKDHLVATFQAGRGRGGVDLQNGE